MRRGGLEGFAIFGLSVRGEGKGMGEEGKWRMIAVRERYEVRFKHST